jgi:hypothetical protein
MLSHHDLAQEFPEMKDAIHNLKLSDQHFARLASEYEDIAKELHRADEGAGAIDDLRAEKLKKQRAELKDQLYALLKAQKQCGTNSCGCGA